MSTARLNLTPTIVLATALSLISACSAPQPTSDNQIQIHQREYRRIFQAAVDILRQHDFNVSQQDYRFGNITTAPQAAPSIVEPWRPAGSSYRAVQAGLNRERRYVKITLHPDAADQSESAKTTTPSTNPLAAPGTSLDLTDGPYLIRVQVILERFQRPGAQLVNSVRQPIASLSAHPQEWQRRGIEPQYWRPVGQDIGLARQLLAQIVRRSIQITDPDAPPPDPDRMPRRDAPPPPTEGL